MNVRQATEADIPHIIRMGRLFWAQTEHVDIPYCPDSIAHSARVMINQGLLLIAEDDSKVIGAIGAIASPLYANLDILFAIEMYWWVEPEYRNSGAGKMLLVGMEKACKEIGVRKFSMIVLANVEPAKAVAMYEPAGYHLSESTYTKVL